MVGGDAAGDDNGGRLEIVISFFSLIDQGFNGGVLETGCHIMSQFIVYQPWKLVRRKSEVFAHLALNGPQNGCLKPREGKIVLASELGDGQVKGAGITEFGCFGDGRAARVGQANDFGDLVKRLANGVILGLANELVVAVILKQDKLRVTARDDEGEEGEGGLMVWQDKTKASWRPLIGADGFAFGAAGCIRRRGDGCQLPARGRDVCLGVLFTGDFASPWRSADGA